MPRTPRLSRLLLAALVAVLCAAAGAAVVSAQDEPAGAPAPFPVREPLRDASGAPIGTVTIDRTRFGTLDVDVRITRGVRTGFHAFHVHAVGRCEGPGFQSAGGHAKAPGQEHGQHAGDLPPVLVKGNGTATQRVTTDLITADLLRDADGSAVIVHAGRDNQANIPPRYGTPDRETLDTGDAGGRVGCAVIPPSGG